MRSLSLKYYTNFICIYAFLYMFLALVYIHVYARLYKYDIKPRWSRFICNYIIFFRYVIFLVQFIFHVLYNIFENTISLVLIVPCEFFRFNFVVYNVLLFMCEISYSTYIINSHSCFLFRLVPTFI